MGVGSLEQVVIGNRRMDAADLSNCVYVGLPTAWRQISPLGLRFGSGRFRRRISVDTSKPNLLGPMSTS